MRRTDEQRQAIRDGLARRRARGLPTGRGREFDRARIAELLGAGLSLTQVADRMGCSTWPVQQVRSQLKNTGKL